MSEVLTTEQFKDGVIYGSLSETALLRHDKALRADRDLLAARVRELEKGQACCSSNNPSGRGALAGPAIESLEGIAQLLAVLDDTATREESPDA